MRMNHCNGAVRENIVAHVPSSTENILHLQAVRKISAQTLQVATGWDWIDEEILKFVRSALTLLVVL